MKDLNPDDVLKSQEITEQSNLDQQSGGSMDEASVVEDGSDEVTVVGYGEYDGHLIVDYDAMMDEDGDTVIIDVDDNDMLSEDGNMVAETGPDDAFVDFNADDSLNQLDDDVTSEDNDVFYL